MINIKNIRKLTYFKFRILSIERKIYAQKINSGGKEKGFLQNNQK